MQIKQLQWDFGYTGRVIVNAWAVLHTKEDCDQFITWLQSAKKTMDAWKEMSDKAESFRKPIVVDQEAKK